MNTIKIFLAESGRVADLHKDFPLYQGQFNDKLLNVYVPTSILAPQFDIQHYIGYTSGATLPTDEVLDAFVLANTYPAREGAQGDIVEFFDTDTVKYYLYEYDGEDWGSTEVDGFGTINTIAGTNIKIGMLATKRDGSIYKSKSYFMRYLKTLTYQGVEYALYERKLPKEFTSFVGQGQNAPTLVANVVNVDTDTKKVISAITTQTCSLDVMTSTMLDQDELMDASDYDELYAKVNQNTADIAYKQDKHDESLTTTSKYVVGAITELQTDIAENTTGVERNTQDIVDIKAEQVIQNGEISTNTYDIGINTNNISNLETRVSNLEQQSGVEETYIGQMTGTLLPTQAQLNAFVLETAHRASQGGDVIIFIQTIPDATDKTYKYTYSLVTHTWSYYEIPAAEPASNTSKGLVQGSYNETLSPTTQVNIVNGEIEDLYVVDGNSTKRRIREYLNTDHSTLVSTTSKAIQNEQDIATNTGNISALQTNVGKIIDGTTTVGKATSATQDGIGNNIVNTYLTQNAGVTKTQMKDYALPRTFNDVSFFTALGYSSTVPTDPSPIHTLTTSAVGDFEIFTAEKTISNAEFELSSKNSYIDTIFAYASVNCAVEYRLTTDVYVGGDWVTANVELTETINMVAGQIKKLSFASPFNSLTSVLDLADGNKIRQKLEVVTDTSQEIQFAIYSNETYPSTFYLNTTSQSIILAQGKLGELPVYNLIGSGDATKVTFTLPLETQIDDKVEALYILNYSGTTSSSTQVELSYNAQAIPLVVPRTDGTNNNATVGDLLGKWGSNIDRWVFTGIFKVNGANISVIADVDNVGAYLSNYYTQAEITSLLSGKQNSLTASQLTAVNSGIDSTKVAQIATNASNISANSTNISTLQSTTGSLQSQVSGHTTSIAGLTTRVGAAESDIDAIEAKIPVQASSSNQLADKQFVNSSIQTQTAYFRGSWATWSAVPTSANDYPADANGNKTPTTNDYMVVQDASGYTLETLAGTWRFKYSGVWSTDGIAGWLPEYQINETPLTSAQLAALNSGANTTNIGQIATNTTNIGLNTSAIGDNTTAISGLSTRMGTAENNISAIPNNYVSYTASQTLTDAQKAQARQNIGAGSSGFSGSYTDLTSLPTLDTTQTTAQTTSASETITGNIKLHKVAKTGTASDLIGYSNLATASSVTNLASRVSDTETAISTINGKIPSGASTTNQLVDTTTMNSSISTATATFRGTYNVVSDLNLSYNATTSQIATALASAISTADNNDYCFVQIPTADETYTQIARVDRYKYSSNAWSFEYTLNNSGYTAYQWAAINSGANSTNISSIDGKVDKTSSGSKIYGTNGSGVQTTYSIGTASTNIPTYNSNASLTTATPVSNTDAANKDYVDTALLGKMPYNTLSTNANLWELDNGWYKITTNNIIIYYNNTYGIAAGTDNLLLVLDTSPNAVVNKVGYLYSAGQLKVLASTGNHSSSTGGADSYAYQSNINNAALTIQKNGTDVATFTANASSNVTANISVPTATSQLTNDSGFITSAEQVNSIGSNYIRYESGLQICWDRKTFSSVRNGTTPFSFGQNFLSGTTPSIAMYFKSPNSGTNASVSGSYNNESNTGFSVTYYGVGSGDRCSGVSYVAIGKWK